LAEDAAPGELLAFIAECVETYEQLEALLWLASHPSEAITSSSLARTLSVPEAALEEALQPLVRARLVARVGGAPELLRYQPGSPELHQSVTKLAAFYAQNRLEVVQLMTENSMRRLQSSTSQTLAFLLGKRD
jgi:hypothetical protein